MAIEFEIKSINQAARSSIELLLTERWGSTKMVSRGRLHDLTALPGFVAVSGGRILGLLTLEIFNNSCEVISLDSFSEGGGIGSALVHAAENVALKQGCTRIWMVTSNDNINALRFYQRKGYRIVTIHRDAITKARKLKPEIPEIGEFGIPIVDEIELEKTLN